MTTKKVAKKVVKKGVVKKATKVPQGTAARPAAPRRRRIGTQDMIADALNRLVVAQERNDPYKRRAEMDAAARANQKREEKLRLERIKNKTFVLSDLQHVIKVGDFMTTSHEGEPIAGIVINFHSERGFFGPMFTITLRVISHHDDGSIGYADLNLRIKDWPGTRSWSEISVRPLTDEVKEMLTARGRVFRDIVKSPSYMSYTGEVFMPTWYGWFPMGGNGRVVVDGLGCRSMMPHIMQAMLSDMRSHDYDDRAPAFDISDNELFMTSPFVPLFSFRQKRWLAGKVSGLTPVMFKTDVFDKLVLDEDRKFIVKSLVKHSGSSFSDIIGGKSGGFIFLLHGPPGVGKTLTAEATAETLQRPLYMVSVGELGTDPQQLETKLGQILELADRWNAVLLLDEADIFLEQRTDHDLERNAMVGIFLRLLEYFNGVMFLTTNRVKNFDRAFHSRISLALHYGEMTDDTRRKVWENLLSAANIKIGKGGINIDKLVQMPLNGRQIKNSIRLAQTIALAKGVVVDEETLLTMSRYAEEFSSSLKTADNYA